MKPLVLYLLMSYAALTAQAVFFTGTKPDVVLILVCFFALRYGQLKGMTYGALSGLVMDIACGFVLGPHIISKSVAGFVIGAVREQLFQWNIIINTIVVTFFAVVNIALVYLIFETFSRVSFDSRSSLLSLLEVVYTVLASIALYPLFRPDRGYR
ncbi:MAG: rod shape-determining protein MreD [Nitrospiraceae bacterium]|nr:MAG: rod shape-determining protein MreD [Nitrospiraceae bacterium]